MRASTYTVSLEVLFYYVTVFGALLLGTILLFSKRNDNASFWLGALVLAFATNLLSHKILNDLYLTYPTFTLRIIPTLFFFGPLIYIYTARLLGQTLPPKYLLWFLPGFIDIIYTLAKAAYVHIFAVDDRWKYYDFGQSEFAQIEFLIHDGLAITYTLGFFLLSWKLSRRALGNEQSLIQTTSSVASVKWLGQIQFLFALLLFVWLGYHVVEISLFPKILLYSAYFPLHLAMALIMLYMGFRGVIQPEIVELVGQRRKYKTSAFSEENLNDFKQRLLHTMQEDRVYLNPELDLKTLARTCDIPEQALSITFSTKLDTNFYQFINRHRIEEAKRQLLDPERKKQTVLNIAYASGFNSHNAFYDAFKKSTGMTPSQFRKSYAEQK